MEKREPPLPLLLSVTYVDVDTVTGRLNENLPKVRSKLVPQSKPKMTTILYSNKVILPPFPPWGKGGGGKGGAKLFSYFIKQADHQMYPPLFF